VASILWAEDGVDDQVLIHHALSQIAAPPAIEFVGDGEAALAALQVTRPDLVVLDLNMPVLDGLETLRRLREDEPTRGLPVVVFSTAREEAAVATCEGLGVLDYIQKPFHYDDFTAAVERICVLARSTRKRAKPGKKATR
jgi:two-component system chemotaxis response regulator CheB